MKYTLRVKQPDKATAPGIAAIVKKNPIREIRQEIGVTQEQLATLLDLTPETVRRYEQGRHETPRLYVLACLWLRDQAED
tara:strand:+ start:117 stop:356 length:240 start_codon:yes stop_codon:yes gene_type:complete